MFASFSHQITGQRTTFDGFGFQLRGNDNRTDAQRKRKRQRVDERTCHMCNKAPTRGWAQGFCGPHAQAHGLRNPRKNHDANSLRHGRERLRQQGMAARVAMGLTLSLRPWSNLMLSSSLGLMSPIEHCKIAKRLSTPWKDLRSLARLQRARFKLAKCEEHTWEIVKSTPGKIAKSPPRGRLVWDDD